MRPPGPATLASIALHAGLGALLFVSWPEGRLELEPVEAIRVSIISERTVAAAAPDNPSEELVVEDGASAPPEPVEAPPAPAPTPTTPPPPPRVAEKKAVTPPRPTPPRTQPPRPPTPQPKRDEPSLDLDRLSERPREGDRRRRPPTGDAGAGQAPRAAGRVDLSMLKSQIIPSCTAAFRDADTEVRITIRIAENGRLVGSPRRVNPRTDPAYRALADSVDRAIRAAAPFRLPAGYQEQDVTLQFTSNSVANC